MSQEVLNCYRTFLEELLKTDCFYVDDKNENKNIVERKNRVSKMIESLNDIAVDDECHTERIQNFIEYLNSIFDKHGIDEWESVCKTLHKKNNKSHKIFFLHKPSECKDINIGSIALHQPRHNSIQIQNYLYVIYCHICHLIHGDQSKIPEGKTKNNYNAIITLFENDNGDKTDSKVINTYTGLLDNVTANGMDGEQLADLVFDQSNPLMELIGGGLRTNLEGILDFDMVKTELKKLDKDDIGSIIGEIKDKLSTIDVSGLISSIQTMDASNLRNVVNDLQNSFSSFDTNSRK